MKSKVLLVVLGLGLSTSVLATTAKFDAKVEAIVTSPDSRFGGCMARLDKNIRDAGLDCPAANWVSFSCSGDFYSKDEALRMFDSAQMAKALDREVEIYVSDTKKHNGYCTVRSIFVN